jgi:hypothetical protein
MFFHKPPYNNKEIPLYFMIKLWVEFIVGKNVNYFYIGDFMGWFEGQHGTENILGATPS